MTSTTQAAALRIVYVVGSGRSGSTLLSGLLAWQEGVLSVGELLNYGNFFATAKARGRRCGCGEPLIGCTFWQAVGEAVQTRIGEARPDLKCDDVALFERRNEAVFAALHEVTGATVIVDSSKRLRRLWRLARSGGEAVRIVHLVRDPRAYGYSSLLTETKKGRGAGSLYRKVFSWQRKNLAVQLLFGRDPRYLRVHYEALVADRDATLARIIEHGGLCTNRRGAAPELHEFSGNRQVIEQGERPLRFDDRYLAALTGAQWWLATALAWPLLIRYGYPLRRRAPRQAARP